MKKILIISLLTALVFNNSVEAIPVNNEVTSYKEEVISFIEQNSLELVKKNEKILNEVQKGFEQSRVELEIIRQEKIAQEEELRRLEEERRLREIVFNPYDILQVSNLSVDIIRDILPDTMKHLAQGYYDVEQKYGINAIFVIALTREESGNGTSEFFNSLNNIGGIRNSDGSFRWFESHYDCLDYIGRLLKNQYLTPYSIVDGEELGLYYNGTSVWGVNIRYCETLDWADKVSNIAYEVLNLAIEKQ